MTSVIICTRNRSKVLQRTLDSLRLMTLPVDLFWELVVVDNGSNDPTRDVVVEFERTSGLVVKYVIEPRPGLSHARNAGLRHAAGDIIAFLDDDVLVGRDYLRSIQNVMEQYPAEGVQGRLLVNFEGVRPRWLDDYIEKLLGNDFGDGVCQLRQDLGLVGANMICRAEVFRKIGGFSPELGAGVSATGFCEDTEFSLRMRGAGYRLIYAPQIVVWHQVRVGRLKKSYFAARYFQIGRSQAYFHKPPSVPLWRYSLYVIKELLLAEARAIRHRIAGRPGRAVREECFALMRFGRCWQFWRFRFGESDRLTGFLQKPMER